MPQSPKLHSSGGDEDEATMYRQLHEDVRDTSKAVQELVIELHKSVVTIATVATELKSLKMNMDDMSKLIREGNSGGIIGRVAVLEQTTTDNRRWIDLHDQLCRANAKTAKDNERASKIQIITALIIAFASIIASVIALISKRV